MPTRRSNASAAAEVAEAAEADSTEAEVSEVTEAVEEATPAPKSVSREPKDDTLSVEDLNLPKSIVQRLAKGVLPPNTQIQKDALLAMSKSATVFVSYLTSCAAETAARSGKKTVMPADVFSAMHDLEFDFMLPRLEAEVTKFTSIQADKRNTYRKKVREEKKAQKEGPADDVVAGAEEMNGDGDERAAKRARMDGEVGASEEEGEGDETVDVEDEEVEDDEIEEEEGQEGEGLVEDALEEKEEERDEDDEMGEGDESD
ncbi:histone-fold-containing protein [Ophiobolus disseminans]|uniref:DNA polymerase epsilon subunit D n=1 Tax=Ophiobolus disseminans TaxID=1469910 RepID=A0A6A7AKB5_9PLEO|nr:histone-fold-containing protein [Ophiobolus disseminans]